MQESQIDPSVEELNNLLRQNGFFETLPTASVPLVAHIFQEYTALKCTISTIRAELLQFRDTANYQQKLLQPIQQDNRRLLEENNALSLRLAEIQDANQNNQTVPLPPNPIAFPQRKTTPEFAEHQAMESELVKLREYSKQLNIKNLQLKEENDKLQREKEWVEKMSSSKQKSPLKAEQTIGATASVRSPNQANIAYASSIQNTSNTTQSTQNEQQIDSRDVHTAVAVVQTEDEQCFQCTIYQQEIQELKLQNKSSKQSKVQEISQTSQHYASEIAKQNSQLSLMQQQIDSLQAKLKDKETQILKLQSDLEIANQTAAAEQATAIAITALSQKLEAKINQITEEKLALKEEIQNHKNLSQQQAEEIKEMKFLSLKQEKTCKKLAQALDDAKAKRKLDEGVICKLDKANSVMSNLMSRLSLENERLKRQQGSDKAQSEQIQQVVVQDKQIDE